MSRSYSVAGEGSLAASATLPFMTLISTASIRTILLQIESGSDSAPAENVAKFAVQRCTTAGTPGSSLAPAPLDSVGDPAAITTCGLGTFSVGPTLTAAQFLLKWAQNQRQSYRWQPFDKERAIRLPATANNGIAVLPLSNNNPYNEVMTLTFEE